jgi:hypothetical protein
LRRAGPAQEGSRGQRGENDGDAAGGEATTPREFMRLSKRRPKRVIERRDELSGYVKDIIRQGIDEGAFDLSTDESVAATAIFELMKTSHLWHRPTGPLSLAELGDWYATFAIRGLGGPRWDHRRPALP